MGKFVDSTLGKIILFIVTILGAFYDVFDLRYLLVCIVIGTGVWVILKFKNVIKEHPIYTCSTIAILTVIVHFTFYYSYSFSFKKQNRPLVYEKASTIPIKCEDKPCPIIDINQLIKLCPDNTNHEKFSNCLDQYPD